MKGDIIMVNKAKIPEDKDNNLSISMEMEIFLQKICELSKASGFNFSTDNILEHIKVLMEHSDRLRLGLSDSDNFLTISQIEEITLDLFRRQREINLIALLTEMSQIKGESGVIEKQSNSNQQKGVKLRNYQRYKNSVLTLMGRVTYTRMALVPSKPKDKQKLKEMGIEGYVYPVDDAFGLTHLPFKLLCQLCLKSLTLPQPDIHMRKQKKI
jgi:hypothetical protein